MSPVDLTASDNEDDEVVVLGVGGLSPPVPMPRGHVQTSREVDGQLTKVHLVIHGNPVAYRRATPICVGHRVNMVDPHRRLKNELRSEIRSAIGLIDETTAFPPNSTLFVKCIFALGRPLSHFQGNDATRPLRYAFNSAVPST